MAVTKRGLAWEFLQSFWILFTLIPLLNWVAFLYIAARVKQWKWVQWAFIYLIPCALLIYALETIPHIDDDPAKAGIAMALFLLGILVSIIHAFLVMGEFLVRLDVKTKVAEEKLEQLRQQIEADTAEEHQ